MNKPNFSVVLKPIKQEYPLFKNKKYTIELTSEGILCKVDITNSKTGAELYSYIFAPLYEK